MTTVRELVTVWGFKADTSKVNAFNAAIDRAKSASRLALKGLAAFAAGTAATGLGVFKLTEKIAEQAHEISRASARTGLGVGVLQELKFAAARAQVPFEALSRGLKQFTLGTGKAAKGNKEAKDAFSLLGIEIKDSHGHLRKSDDLLVETMFKLAGVENETTKLTLAQKLFGRGSMALLPLLEDGAEDLAKLMVTAHESGKVLGGPALKSGKDMAKGLHTLSNVVGSLKAQLGSALMPYVSQIVTKINAWVKANKGLIGQRLQDIARSIGLALKDLMDQAERGHLFEALTEIVKALASAMAFLARHGRELKWLFAAIIALNVAGRLKPLVSVVGSLAQALPGAAKGMSALSASTALWGAGIVGAAAAGYAFGTWLDKTLGLSDKLADSLVRIKRLTSKSATSFYGMGVNRESVVGQAREFADVIRRGGTSVGRAGGGRMQLTQENMIESLRQTAEKLGVNEDNWRYILPRLKEATDVQKIKREVAISNQVGLAVNLSVQPVTPAVANRVGKAAANAAVNELRRAMGDMANR